MSCTFWLRRKKKAAMLREQECNNIEPVKKVCEAANAPTASSQVEEAAKETKRAVKKAVKSDDNQSAV